MSGTVSTKHPDYLDRVDEWALMRDCARGETAVKTAGERYLPMPSGFRGQEDGGAKMFEAYQTRAQFSEILAPTIRGKIGVIHRTEAQIDVPPAMQGLWERATADDLPLEALPPPDHGRAAADRAVWAAGRCRIGRFGPSLAGRLYHRGADQLVTIPRLLGAGRKRAVPEWLFVEAAQGIPGAAAQ